MNIRQTINLSEQVWDNDLADTAKAIADLCTTDSSMFDLEPGIGLNSAHIIEVTEEIDFTTVLSVFWESEGPPGYDIYNNECEVPDSVCHSYKQVQAPKKPFL